MPYLWPCRNGSSTASRSERTATGGGFPRMGWSTEFPTLRRRRRKSAGREPVHARLRRSRRVLLDAGISSLESEVTRRPRLARPAPSRRGPEPPQAGRRPRDVLGGEDFWRPVLGERGHKGPLSPHFPPLPVTA